MEYTKGEWEVELFNKDRGEQGVYFIGNGEVSIATMTSVPEVKANAHLISKAPRMYEMLQHLYELGILAESCPETRKKIGELLA